VVFGLVDAILLRPLAFDRPEQLVKVWGAIPKQGIPQNWISEPEFWDLRDGLRGPGRLLHRNGREPIPRRQRADPRHDQSSVGGVVADSGCAPIDGTSVFSRRGQAGPRSRGAS
jgi:hypothetical protein